jgi:hypothetical protein
MNHQGASIRRSRNKAGAREASHLPEPARHGPVSFSVTSSGEPPSHRNAGEEHANDNNDRSDLNPDEATQRPPARSSPPPQLNCSHHSAAAALTWVKPDETRGAPHQSKRNRQAPPFADCARRTTADGRTPQSTAMRCPGQRQDRRARAKFRGKGLSSDRKAGRI